MCINMYVLNGACTKQPVRKNHAPSKGGQGPQRVRQVVHYIEGTSFSQERPYS